MVIHDNIVAHQNKQYEFYCEGRACTLGKERWFMAMTRDRHILWPRVVEVRGNLGSYDGNITILCEECAIKAGILW